MKKSYLLVSLLLSLLTTGFAYAYPPDNAAVIYYQQMVGFVKPEEPMWNQIAKAAKGEVEINEQIQQYLNSKQSLILTLQIASQIPNCDWGLNLSQGLALEVPFLSKMREFAYLLMADARLKAQQKQFQDAISLCLTNIRMANHVGNDTTISYLVGNAMTALSYDRIADIMSIMPPNEATLMDIQSKLQLPEYNMLDIKKALTMEQQCIYNEIQQMTPEKVKLISEQGNCSEEMKKDLPLLTQEKPDFLKASADYYQAFLDKYIASLDQPYLQVLATSKNLEDTLKKDYNAGKKEAFATTLTSPAVMKIIDIDVRRKTQQNALLTAIQLYCWYINKGTLPENLPAAFPKDLFSGQTFDYTKTNEGFTLHCRQADMKGKIYEYTFKLTK